MTRRRPLELVLAVLIAAGVGCTVTTSVGGPPNVEYESCAAGNGCAGGSGTTCQQTEFTSGAGQGLMCTASCSTNGDCPPDFNGGAVDCVISDPGSPGQCYIDCNGDAAVCKGGTQCTSLDGFFVCVP